MAVRVLIAALPLMLHDIIYDALTEQPTLHVVARLGDADDVEAAASKYNADVIVMTAPPEQIRAAEHMLYARPRMRVLMLAPDGRSAHLYRLVPQCMSIDDVSPTQLVSAIVQSTPTSESQVQRN